jgi:uncharacterized protein
MTLILTLLVIQGLMGAFDTLYHHELRAKLPLQTFAALELRIHGIRSVLYAVVFAGLAFCVWGGVWTLVLGAIVAVEAGLTLWDFLTKNRSRKLPWSERVLHTILAINGGAVFCLLAIEMLQWWALPNQLLGVNYGWFTPVLGLFALGVFASGVRDSFASSRLRQLAARPTLTLDFGGAQHFLITGATGFIGQVLVKSLTAQGHHVTAWVRDPIAATHQLGGQVRLVQQLQVLGAQHFDVIINLAGESIAGGRWSAARKQALISSRVQTTQALLDWLDTVPSALRPALVMSASAIGYYGNQAQGDAHALCETDAPRQPRDFGSQLCQLREQACDGFTALGVRHVSLRLGVVLGHQGALPSMLLPFRAFGGGRIGDGQQVLSWVHIHDALAAMAHIARSAGAQGAYNITAPQPLTNQSFAHIAGQVLQRPSFIPAPAWIFKCVFGEMSSLFTQGLRVMPARLLAEGFVFEYPDLRAALVQLEQ